MIRKKVTVAGLAAAVILGGLGSAATIANAGPSGRGTGSASSSVAVSSLTAEVKADLVFMVQEERLAKDVYNYVISKYGVGAPFTNIALSEQQHQDAVAALLKRYGLTDPSAGMQPGRYADANLQDMYNTLIARVDRSLAESYQVGITIEVTDIADLKEALAKAGVPRDVTSVYEHLLAGSQNHLRAFTNCAAGVTGGSNAVGSQRPQMGRSQQPQRRESGDG